MVTMLQTSTFQMPFNIKLRLAHLHIYKLLKVITQSIANNIHVNVTQYNGIDWECGPWTVWEDGWAGGATHHLGAAHTWSTANEES